MESLGSGENMRLVNVLGAAWVGSALESEGGVEDVVFERLFQSGVCALSTRQDEARPNAVALDALKGPGRRRVGEHIAEVVELIAKLDKFGSRRDVGHMLHLSSFSGRLGEGLVISDLEIEKIRVRARLECWDTKTAR